MPGARAARQAHLASGMDVAGGGLEPPMAAWLLSLKSQFFSLYVITLHKPGISDEN
jgi:hypothetical protein